MSAGFPDGFRIEILARAHNRAAFDCGVAEVNDWLKTRALQGHEKNLSVTRVLVDAGNTIAGYYTLAHGHVRLDQLPRDIARRLPDQLIPVAVLAWLGVDRAFKGRGLGDQLLAHALNRCLEGARVMPFVAVVLDCLNEAAKAFFTRFQFQEFPGHPMKPLLPRAMLDALADSSKG